MSSGKSRWNSGSDRGNERSCRCKTSIPASSASRATCRHTIHIVGVGDNRIGTVRSRKIRGERPSTDPYRACVKCRLLPVMRTASLAIAVARYTSSSGSASPNTASAGFDHASDLLRFPDDGEEAVTVWCMREAPGNGLGKHDLVITHCLDDHHAANPRERAAETRTLQSMTTFMFRGRDALGGTGARARSAREWKQFGRQRRCDPPPLWDEGGYRFQLLWASCRSSRLRSLAGMVTSCDVR